MHCFSVIFVNIAVISVNIAVISVNIAVISVNIAVISVNIAIKIRFFGLHFCCRHVLDVIVLQCKAIEFGEKRKIRAITPFSVIQGHRFQYQSKAHVRLPIIGAGRCQKVCGPAYNGGLGAP